MATSMLFPDEMMHDDSVWVNRLVYDEAETECQIALTCKRDAKDVSQNEAQNQAQTKGGTRKKDWYQEEEEEDDSLGSFSDSSTECVEVIKDEEEASSSNAINVKDFVSTSDFILLRDAVINLTQAVSTLSIQNENLKKENTKLKNRMDNTEVRVSNVVKSQTDVPGKVDKLTNRMKNAEQAMESLRKTTKSQQQQQQQQPKSNQVDTMKVHLEALFTQGLKQLHQQTAEAITALQTSQQNDKYDYDDQLKSVKQYLLDKDFESKEKMKEMKLDILSIVERKNQVIEQAIQNVVKHQTKRGSFEYYSDDEGEIAPKNEGGKKGGSNAHAQHPSKGSLLTSKAPPNLKVKNRGSNSASNSSDLSSWLDFNKEQSTQYSNSVKNDSKGGSSSNSSKGSSSHGNNKDLQQDSKGGTETSFFGLGTNPSAAAPYCDVKINDPVVTNWFQWKLPKRNPTDTEIIHHSITFLTGTPGYRAQLRAKIDRLHGDIYFSARILQGMFDEYLQWPFPLKFTIRVSKTNEKNDEHTWLIPKEHKWKNPLGKPSMKKEKVFSEWVGPFNLSSYLMRRQIPLEFVPCT